MSKKIESVFGTVAGQMKWLVGMGVLGGLGACVPTGAFECAQSTQCSRSADGVCQADGHCSYPDSRCDSGHRYSDFAGALANACVPEESVEASTGSTSGSEGSEGSESSGIGPQPESCEGVDCSGQGHCVLIDDAPTCACDPGLYPLDLTCVEDPCDAVACRFVATDGDDANDGSREAPWRTIARLEQGLAAAVPGDHFLLRRGEQWSEALDIVDVVGALDAPIVVGAYGPLQEPAPRLAPGALRLTSSDHLVVRDLWIEDDPDDPLAPNRPCVMVERSHHVTILHDTVTRCVNRGIRLHEDAAYVALVDNEVRDVADKAGIFVADASWDMPPARIGAHHWIIDNVVTGIPENGITVGTTDATTDVKVLGNVVSNVTRTGISIAVSGWAWSVGNAVSQAGDEVAGLGQGMVFDAAAGWVSGNIVLHSRLGLDLRGSGTVRLNTIVHEASGTAVTVGSGARDLAISDNLVLAQAGATWVRLNGDPLDESVSLDLDWYTSDAAPCMFDALGMMLDLAGLQDATGLAGGSSCAAVPGLGAVPVGLPPEAWDDAFWATLQPGSDWARCDDPAGARGCDGAALGTALEPIPEYFENDGIGWAGPLLVRQRYVVAE